jgi:hypothetical protein
MMGCMIHGSYILDFTVLMPLVAVSYALSCINIPSHEEYQSLETWHTCLGHLHHDMIRNMAANRSVTRLKSQKQRI